MMAQSFKIGLLVPAMCAVAACTARPSIESTGIISANDVNPSLIAVGGQLQELALARTDLPPWEDFRNDVPWLDPDLPVYSPWEFLEVRHREHLRTISGRPREFSSTTTRTIRRELRP